MYKIDYCPVCNSTDLEKQPAFLSNFVNWRVTGIYNETHIPTHSVRCNDCSYFGSEDRLTVEDANNLYADYRGATYNEMRVVCEPKYLERQSMFDEHEYMSERATNINNLINKHVNPTLIHSILDYGGSNGAHIPKQFVNSRKFVYEISDVSLIDGVESFNLDEVRTFDLLMCCHVLEHLSDPNETVIEIKKFANTESFLYFEVPGYSNPPPDNPIFHEHINVYNVKSLTTLLNRNGIEVIDHSADGKYVCILGKLK